MWMKQILHLHCRYIKTNSSFIMPCPAFNIFRKSVSICLLMKTSYLLANCNCVIGREFVSFGIVLMLETRIWTCDFICALHRCLFHFQLDAVSYKGWRAIFYSSCSYDSLVNRQFFLE